MSQTLELSPLPSAVRQKLQAVRLRSVALLLTKAILTTTAAFAICVTMAMSIDWYFVLERAEFRWITTIAALAPVIWLIGRLVIQPLRKTWGWDNTASQIDHAVPELEERWTTLAGVPSGVSSHGTDIDRAMLQQVASEAAAMNRLVVPQQIANVTQVRKSAVLAATGLLLLSMFLASEPRQTKILWQRFWNPNAQVTATTLASTTGNVVVPKGSSVELLFTMDGRLHERALLELRGESFLDERTTLAADQDSPNHFRTTIDADESFHYRISAGDGRTEWHKVTAVDHPMLEVVELTIESPRYTGMDDITKSIIPTRLKVVQGGRLLLKMKASQPLQSFEMLVWKDQQNSDRSFMRDADLSIALQPSSDGWYSLTLPVLQDFTFQPLFTSSHGLASIRKQICQVDVMRDQSPVARITSPTDELTVLPQDQIEVEFTAHDDHGISKVELVIYEEAEDGSGEPKILEVRDIPLGNQQMQKRIAGSTKLDLSDFDLQEGQRLSYSIRATDNRQLDLTDIDAAALFEPQTIPNEDAPSDADLRTSATDSVASTFPQDVSETAESGSDEDTSERTDLTRDSQDAVVSSSNRDPDESATSDRMRSTGEPERNMESELVVETANDATTAAPSVDKARVDQRSGPADSTTDDRSEQSTGDDVADRDSSAEADTQPATADSARGFKMPVDTSGDDNSDSAVPSDFAMPSGESNSNKPSSPRDNDLSSQPPSAGDLSKQPEASKESGVPPQQFLLLTPQSNDGEPDSSNRRTLRVTSRLSARAEANNGDEAQDIRSQVEEIDQLLIPIQQHLTGLVANEVSESARSDAYRSLEKRLQDVELFIDELQQETADGKYAFVGLQMAVIGTTHVSPARNGVFAAIRQPEIAAEAFAPKSLHHITTARELLQDLLKRYERVEQEQQLSNRLNEAAELYEVFVERSQVLMREARQNLNPLERKMAVLQVDEAYLDRFAEVLALRREMMAELSRILADDPRLLNRYMDLIRRRRVSLRDQLTEIVDRQDELLQESNSWLQISPQQQPALWRVISQLRLHAGSQIAKDAAQLADTLRKQIPLSLDPEAGYQRMMLTHADHAAVLARNAARQAADCTNAADFEQAVQTLPSAAFATVNELQQMMATLDALAASSVTSNDDDISNFTNARLAEARLVLDQSESWLRHVEAIQRKSFHDLADDEQSRLTITTERLRVQLLSIQSDLEEQLQGEGIEMPEEMRQLATELKAGMSAAVAAQMAAGIHFEQADMRSANAQQQAAAQHLQHAEKVFDQLRVQTVELLDQVLPDDPDIADLQDPTLDQFLQQLEREPDLEALLGIPNRPQNLRILADSLMWQQDGDGGLSMAGENASSRAARMRSTPMDPNSADRERRELTEQEKQLLAQADDMREMIQQKLRQTNEQMQRAAADNQLSQAERDQAAEQAQQLQQVMQDLQEATDEEWSAQAWNLLAESDQTAGVLRTLLSGKQPGDEQWNEVRSKLGDGLWQVRGRTPPERYRGAIESYQDRIRRLPNAQVSP